jgi:hypothetical protein
LAGNSARLVQCADVLLHQLRDDFVLLDELGLQPSDLFALPLFLTPRLARPPKSRLGLGQHLVEPAVDLAGLHAQFLRQLRDRLLAGHVPADNLSLLLGGKMSANTIAHGIILRLGLC